MLEKLKTLYGEKMMASGSAQKHEALWFQTDEGETFGVLKEAVTEREKQLLLALFQPFSESQPSQLTPVRKNGINIFCKCPAGKPGKHPACPRTFFQNETFTWRKTGHQRSGQRLFRTSDYCLVRSAWSAHHSRRSFSISPEKGIGATFRRADKRFSVNPSVFQRPASSSQCFASRKIRFEKQMFQHILANSERGKVTSFCQCLPSFLLAAPDKIKASLLSDAIRDALSDQETSLTIRTYMRCNLNASLTAKRLFIHRNSLQYRIDKFIERTAIDIRQFEEAAAVYFILHFLKLL